MSGDNTFEQAAKVCEDHAKLLDVMETNPMSLDRLINRARCAEALYLALRIRAFAGTAK